MALQGVKEKKTTERNVWKLNQIVAKVQFHKSNNVTLNSLVQIRKMLRREDEKPDKQYGDSENKD